MFLLNERGPRIVSRQGLEALGFSPEHGDVFLVFDIVDAVHPVEISPGVVLPNVKAKYEPYFLQFKESFC